MPVLRAQVHAFEHVAAQLLELIEAGGPHNQHFHALLDAEVHCLAQGVGRLAAEVEQHQHVGLGGDGVGQVAGKLLLLQRVVAVADVFHTELGEHLAGVVQQGIAEYILRGDGVPAFGLRQLADHRHQGLADGAVGRHRPAEGRGVAVLAGDFIGADGGHEHTTGLVDFLRHRQCRGGQGATLEEARAILADGFLHLAHRLAGVAFGVDDFVLERVAEQLRVLGDGQARAHVGVLAVAGEGARHGLEPIEGQWLVGECPVRSEREAT
ncbi:hypothetical protein D3C71_1374380 [compost metagenome]